VPPSNPRTSQPDAPAGRPSDESPSGASPQPLARPWSGHLWPVLLTTGLVAIVALGSRRSFARVSSGQSLLDIRLVSGDLFVLTVAVLGAEVCLLAYVIVSALKKGSLGAGGRGRHPPSFWQRMVAALMPLVLLAVLAAALARRGQSDSGTPAIFVPPPPVPSFGGASGPGSPPVVHWWVLLAIGLLAVGIVLALVLRRHRRRAITPGPAVSQDQEREELRAVVEASLEELEDVADPRTAVIDAYARMERVLAEHGLPRRPAETPLEYLARWTGVMHVGRTAAEALATLYERARFSLHLIDEEMRREAVEALGALRGDLGAPG
jgi:hypothetical protein